MLWCQLSCKVSSALVTRGKGGLISHNVQDSKYVFNVVGSLLERTVNGNCLKTLVVLFLVFSPFALILVGSPFHFKVYNFRLAA